MNLVVVKSREPLRSGAQKQILIRGASTTRETLEVKKKMIKSFCRINDILSVLYNYFSEGETKVVVLNVE